MFQLVLKNGKVVAVHKMETDISGKYPDAEIVVHHTHPEATMFGFGPDPRTEDEKANAYIGKRILVYPTIRDQLDMIYHDRIDGTEVWRDAITAVKEQFPKPTVTLK